MTEVLVIALPALPALAAGLVLLAPSGRAADRFNLVVAVLTAAVAATLVVLALAAAPGVAATGGWYTLDSAAGVFLALAAAVGLASAAVSPVYLRHAGGSWFGERRSHVYYYAAFNLFWAALLALPLAGNLVLAWLLIEATTAASALLVAFSGKRSALEAGWKYLLLTTLGLSVALFGIVVLYVAVGGHGSASLDWGSLSGAAAGLPTQTTLFAFVLIVAGFAAKIGWAPVHNWLPDAHSEAPAPVSALLSAALLPIVLLIAWRTQLALAPALARAAIRELFLGFGRSRSPSPCPSSGAPCRGSGCSPTRASSTWGSSRSGSASARRWRSPASSSTWSAMRSPSRSASMPRSPSCGRIRGRRGGRRAGWRDSARRPRPR